MCNPEDYKFLVDDEDVESYIAKVKPKGEYGSLTEVIVA